MQDQKEDLFFLKKNREGGWDVVNRFTEERVVSVDSQEAGEQIIDELHYARRINLRRAQMLN